MRGHRQSRQPDSAANKQRARPVEIDRSRDRYIADIATFRKLAPETNSFIDKAQRLLTTHWAAASWAGRLEILKTVDWCLRLGTSMPAPRRARIAESPRS
jgi:hypothetical protein